jgi:hypothetical protein
VNSTGIDFGTVAAGGSSTSKSLIVTYTGSDTVICPDSMMPMYVSTDLSISGVHLIVGKSQELHIGMTYMDPVTSSFPLLNRGDSKTLLFRIEVDPNTDGADINFHIVISHD